MSTFGIFLLCLICLFVVFVLGLLTAALCVVSHRADERIERENRGYPGDGS